jgi:ferredoxin
MVSVRVDLGLCQGHGRCLEVAPEVFEYDDVSNQAYVIAGTDAAAWTDLILEAVSACPEGAISTDA